MKNQKNLKRNKREEKRILITGNEAMGEAAVTAGCRFYAGYPITPQNELTAYMANRMNDVGGVFIQAESELAAINMVFGASASGVRAMTSSSSPGISLKQEGISYIAGCELPAVIMNVQRGGPGLGNIAPSQGDYFQATKGGGHGDYNLIVLAPSSAQESFNLTMLAFELADKYRNPVMVLSDAFLGQMAEPITLSTQHSEHNVKKDWALTGAKGRKQNIIRSMFLSEGALEEHNIALQKKYKEVKEKERRFEASGIEDADIIFTAYGISSRIARGAANLLREKGLKGGIFRPITLWPFPYDELQEASRGKRAVFVFELSYGQMVEDVHLSVKDRVKVFFYGRGGGGVFTEEELVNFVESKL